MQGSSQGAWGEGGWSRDGAAGHRGDSCGLSIQTATSLFCLNLCVCVYLYLCVSCYKALIKHTCWAGSESETDRERDREGYR